MEIAGDPAAFLEGEAELQHGEIRDRGDPHGTSAVGRGPAARERREARAVLAQREELAAHRILFSMAREHGVTLFGDHE